MDAPSTTESAATDLEPVEAHVPASVRIARAPVTTISILVCIAIWVGLSMSGEGVPWHTLRRFGLLPPTDIWDGEYWGLVTPAFVHFEIWHLAFNMCWLWILGSRLERAIGPLRYLAFIAVSAFVASAFQLAISETTGIGFSGVLYAMFGFMWPAAYWRYPEFRDVIHAANVRLMLGWAVLCVVITHLEAMNIGNAAHFSGLAFGIAVAGATVARGSVRAISAAGLVALVLAAATTLFWSPWSVRWLSHQAYEAHAILRYQEAVDRYTQIIRKDPANAWAHLNRSYAYSSIGQNDLARADEERYRQLDPTGELAR